MNSPKEMAMIELQFQRAKAGKSPAERQAGLKAVLKEMDTKPERFAKNPAGYNYRLAQVLGMWALEPGVGYTPTREALGFQTNGADKIDLVVALDAAYKAVAAAAPACENDLKADRQNEVWLAMTRKALDASNAGQMDTAALYANRSLLLSRDNPYPYYVLANVANSKKDAKTAIANWKSVITAAGTDTNYRELATRSLYMVGVTQLEQAMAAAGPDKAAQSREAAGTFKQLFAQMKDSPEAPSIMQSWSEALQMAGDEASIPTIYADMLAKPANYSEGVLTLAGSFASIRQKPEDAIALFEGALVANPFSHDALLNLPLLYNSKSDYEKMLPPARKSVELEPNNSTAWMWFAYYAQGKANAVKIPTAKNKAAPTPAEVKAIKDSAAVRKAWADSLTKYQTLADGLPVKVDVAAFNRGKETSVTLRFEQQAAKEGSYSVTLEFLDKAGTVVGSATESVGPIKKGENKQATFKTTAANVVGYRYKAIK
jgi:tetratricopeptide (TPR) repeat protein